MSSRSPTLRDIASRAGVSLSSVSLVLNGKPGVSQERKDRILEAIAALQYVHQPKKVVVRQRQPVIGLIMETLSPSASRDGFIAEVVSGVEAGLHSAGLRMLLHLYRKHDDPVSDLRALMGRDVDGMIITNGGDIDATVIEKIMGTGVPTVLVENYLETQTHSVVADNFTAGLRATDYLISLGHQRIGMLVGSSRYISLTDRRRGYEAALLAGDLPVERELMPPQPPSSGLKGYVQMRTLISLQRPPTAVYAVSDKSAMGAYAAVVEAGLSIPRDISIVGTDDVAESLYLTPPLTTFSVPKFELGRAAAQKMLALLGSDPPAPSRTVLLGKLKIRQSTRPPAGW